MVSDAPNMRRYRPFVLDCLVISFLWLACLKIKTLANQDRSCRTIHLLPIQTGQYFEGHVFMNLTVGKDGCEHWCLMENKCVSVNIGSGKSPSSVICELSDSDHCQHPEDLKPRQGWTYRGTKNPCCYNPCLNNGKCLLGYTDKKYVCECPSGFTGKNCENDVDECNTGSHDCNENATCTNTVGNFNCTCKPGFTGDGRSCTDVNECSTGIYDCNENATCANTAGNFNCTCKTGFTGDGRSCSDVDECNTGSHDCNENATCANTAGNFNCTCKPGFTGDGRSCLDVDECSIGIHDCNENATCANTAGNFNCTCKPGFTGDGRSCSDVDECNTGSHDCNENATCTNTAGNFNCTCKPGFTGDGRSCTDADECSTGIHDCNENATCANTARNFNCTCKTGFTGDGRSCSDCTSKLNYFTKHQDLPTQLAWDVEVFTIDGSLFMAFAEDHDSFIYKLNETAGNFTLHHTIATIGAYDIEYFMIADKHYIAIANNWDGSIYNLNSSVFQWNGHSFELWQNISTSGATSFNFFKIHSELFVAVTNSYDGSSSRINSSIYKWKDNKFEELQEIRTQNAKASAVLTIDNETFIVFANWNDSDSSHSSDVMKWSGKKFIDPKFPQIFGLNVRDLKSFTIDDTVFLAFATTTGIVIYKWDGEKFVNVNQTFSKPSDVWSVHTFTMCGQTFLCATGLFPSELVLYVHSESKFMAMYQDIENKYGPTGVTSFEHTGHTYLAVANSYWDNSIVYKSGLKWF